MGYNGDVTTTYGLKFTREWEPEHMLPYARATEAAGFDELWLVEDLGFHGGFGPCGAALAATEHITVGLGIAPAVVRNAAYLAMEIASLARMFPDRFHMGLGHGVEHWIEQVGATPASWITSLKETTVAVKQILGGGPVSFAGEFVQLDAVELAFPRDALVSFGVRKPKGMELAGEVADGVIFAEASGPRYVERVRRTIGPDSRFTVFIQTSTTEQHLRNVLDARLAQPRFHSQLVDYDGIPDNPYTELGISGPFDTWIAKAQPWVDAGADSIVFCPTTEDDPMEVQQWQLSR